jgi:hypothetical protein
MLEKNEINKSVMVLADNQFLYRLDDSLEWLFNTDTGDYWNLNEQSYFVLSLFNGERTVGEISQLYVDRYLEGGVSKELLMQDFKCVMNQFITANVIDLKKMENGKKWG